MGKFTTTQSNLDNQYSYINESVMISGNYILDAKTSAFKNVSGSVFAYDENNVQGDFIGSFSGSLVDGEMNYSLSQMTKAQSDLVWAAINEIEQYVFGEIHN